MTDRIVLCSLIPFDRWAPAKEIALQLASGVSQIQREIADLIADGAPIDTRNGRYRRHKGAIPPHKPVGAPTPEPEVEPVPFVKATAAPTVLHQSTPFSEMLRTAQIAAGLSQNKLARLAKVDPAYVNRMVKGRHVPSRPVAMALADACSLDVVTTDRLLYAAGLAPVADYQTLYDEAQRRLEAIDRAMVGYAPSQPVADRQEIAS